MIPVLWVAALGQYAEVDSLQAIVRSSYNDSIKIKAISDIGYAFERMGNQDSTTHYYQLAIQEANRTGEKFLEAQNLRYMGLYYYSISALDSALKYYLRAEEIFSSIWEGGELGKLLVDIGNLHYVRSDYIPGIEYYQASATYYEKRLNYFGQAVAYGNIGALFYEQDLWEKALFYHQKSYDMARRADNQNSMAAALHNLGGIWEKRDSFTKAKEMYEEALVTIGEEADDYFLSHTYNSLGSVHGKMGQYGDAVEFGQLAVSYANSPALRAGFQIHLGHYYAKANLLKEAEETLIESIDACAELGLKTDLNEGLVYMHQLKARQGDYETAYRYAAWHSTLTDTLFDQEIQDRIHQCAVTTHRQSIERSQKGS